MKRHGKTLRTILLVVAFLVPAAVASAQVLQVDPQTGAFTSEPAGAPAGESAESVPSQGLQTLDAAERDAVEFESPVAGGGVGVTVQGGFLHFMTARPQTRARAIVGCSPLATARVRPGVCRADRNPGGRK